MTTASPLRVPLPVTPPSILTDRSAMTLTTLIVLYLLVRGAFETAGVAANLVPPYGEVYIHLRRFREYNLAAPPSWLADVARFSWSQLFGLAIVVAGLILWRRPRLRVPVVSVLCAMECIAAALRFTEGYYYWFGSGIALVRLLVIVPPVGACAAALYVAWFLWRTRYATGRAVQPFAGALAITGAAEAAAVLLGISQFWESAANSPYPWAWKVRWAVSVLGALGLFCTGLWLLVRKEGTGVPPATLLLVGVTAPVAIWLLVVITECVPLRGSLGFGISQGQGPALALAFLIFALRYKPPAQTGDPTCATCGYSLRGLPPNGYRCPECGSWFVVTAAAAKAVGEDADRRA